MDISDRTSDGEEREVKRRTGCRGKKEMTNHWACRLRKFGVKCEVKCDVNCNVKGDVKRGVKMRREDIGGKRPGRIIKSIGARKYEAKVSRANGGLGRIARIIRSGLIRGGGAGRLIRGPDLRAAVRCRETSGITGKSRNSRPRTASRSPVARRRVRD
jgi:hypothetical protein